MVQLPAFLPLLFAVAVIFCMFTLVRACGNSRAVILVILLWVTLQSLVSSTGFYLNTFVIPPRLILLPLPPILLIIALLAIKQGRGFMDGMNLLWLTWLHVVRIPVELVLHGLYQEGLVPEIMTFEGRNFDIVSGLSAVIICLGGFTKHRELMIVWNFVCLVLLANIVITSILAAPTPAQKLAFEQPNRGVLYFPFALLPAFIVPAVVLSHLAALRQLIFRGSVADNR